VERVRGLVAAVAEATETDLARVRAASESTQQDLAEARDTFTAQAQRAEQRPADVEKEADAQLGQLDQALTAQQAQFEADERQRAEAAEASVKKADEMFAASGADLSQQAAGTLEELAKLKGQAEELLGAMGVAGVAAGYNETAQREKTEADKWRNVTVLVAGVSRSGPRLPVSVLVGIAYDQRGPQVYGSRPIRRPPTSPGP
jgi:hypothetical protein